MKSKPSAGKSKAAKPGRRARANRRRRTQVTCTAAFQRIPPSATISREPAQPPGAGHQMRLVFTGLAWRTFRMEYADNLGTVPVAWQVIGWVAADANGQFELIDPPPLLTRRFYRAVEVP